MDNFKAVYKILSQLEKEMDSEYADIGKFDANALCVSDERWMRYIEMMEDVGYIKGVRIILNDPPKMVHRSIIESEVLYPLGSKFTIINKAEQDGKYYVLLEEK